jgi:hypothetical protein
MNKTMKLLPPIPQNYIIYEVGGVKKGTISITDLFEDEATAYSELIKDEFMKHWRKQMNASIKTLVSKRLTP